MQPVKLGIIGAGIMGSNHMRVALRNGDVKLAAICDSDLSRLEALALRDDVAILTNPSELIGLVDAVIVATPTSSHYELAKMFLENGIACMVEKPITETVEQGRELVELSEKNNVVFQVGHVERFNSAVLALPQYVKDPLHFEFRRISPFSDRVKESIVTDLMIHDLELLRSLHPVEIKNIQAIGQNPLSDWADFASAFIEFVDGTTASLVASRIGQQKVRSIEVSQKNEVVHADLLRQDIVISRVDHVEYTTEGGARFKQHGMMELPFIDRFGEPLMLEQQEFVAAIKENRKTNVNPRTALEALDMAFRIDGAITFTKDIQHV